MMQVRQGMRYRGLAARAAQAGLRFDWLDALVPASDLLGSLTRLVTTAPTKRRVWTARDTSARALPHAAARRVRGFTLIELVIVIAIIGVLAAIAYPAYQDSIIKSNRRAAQGFLMEVSTRQKQYLLDKRSYAASLADLGVAVPGDVAKHYTVTLAVNATPPTFTVTATAQGSSIQSEDGPLPLELESSGAKKPPLKW